MTFNTEKKSVRDLVRFYEQAANTSQLADPIPAERELRVSRGHVQAAQASIAIRQSQDSNALTGSMTLSSSVEMARLIEQYNQQAQELLSLSKSFGSVDGLASSLIGSNDQAHLSTSAEIEVIPSAICTSSGKETRMNSSKMDEVAGLRSSQEKENKRTRLRKQRCTRHLLDLKRPVTALFRNDEVGAQLPVYLRVFNELLMPINRMITIYQEFINSFMLEQDNLSMRFELRQSNPRSSRSNAIMNALPFLSSVLSDVQELERVFNQFIDESPTPTVPTTRDLEQVIQRLFSNLTSLRVYIEANKHLVKPLDSNDYLSTVYNKEGGFISKMAASGVANYECHPQAIFETLPMQLVSRLSIVMKEITKQASNVIEAKGTNIAKDPYGNILKSLNEKIAAYVLQYNEIGREEKAPTLNLK